MGFFGFVPFLMEFSVIFAACAKFKVVNKVEAIQRQLEKEALMKFQEKVKMQTGSLNKEEAEKAKPKKKK